MAPALAGPAGCSEKTKGVVGKANFGARAPLTTGVGAIGGHYGGNCRY